MIQLKGHRIKISGITWSDNYRCPCINADDWSWHPDDLYVVDRKDNGVLTTGGQEGIFMFNPNNLIMNI